MYLGAPLPKVGWLLRERDSCGTEYGRMSVRMPFDAQPGILAHYLVERAAIFGGAAHLRAPAQLFPAHPQFR